jgi:hypothetical protein
MTHYHVTFISGQDFYYAGQRKEIMQAADFIIKAKQQQRRAEGKAGRQGLSHDEMRLISNDRRNEQQAEAKQSRWSRG